MSSNRQSCAPLVKLQKAMQTESSVLNLTRRWHFLLHAQAPSWSTAFILSWFVPFFLATSHFSEFSTSILDNWFSVKLLDSKAGPLETELSSLVLPEPESSEDSLPLFEVELPALEDALKRLRLCMAWKGNLYCEMIVIVMT